MTEVTVKDKRIEEFWLERFKSGLPTLVSQGGETQLHPDFIKAADEYTQQQVQEAVEDAIKMSDQLESDCGRDGDKGTKQWMLFKGFRNTLRDKYLTQPQDGGSNK